MIILIIITRSYAALRAAYLDWIVGPGYSLGGYILGYSQSLASCLRHSARITLLYFDILLYFFPTTLYFSPTLLQFSLTFCSHFHTFDALFQYFFRTLLYFFITFSVLFPFFPLFFAKLKKKFKVQIFFWWHLQFTENIFLLQCLKKEIATAKELDLRPLGKVIIFRVKQTEPSYHI